jgi:hypothetical protein
MIWITPGSLFLFIGFICAIGNCVVHEPVAGRVGTLAIICLGGFLYLGDKLGRK